MLLYIKSRHKINTYIILSKLLNFNFTLNSIYACVAQLSKASDTQAVGRTINRS